MLSLFNVTRFEELAEPLQREDLEGLDENNVRLESFIVSNTPSHTIKRLWNMPKTDMQNRHILFQEEDQDTYVRTMLEYAR